MVTWARVEAAMGYMSGYPASTVSACFTTVPSVYPVYWTMMLPRGWSLELETKVHPKVHNHGEGPY